MKAPNRILTNRRCRWLTGLLVGFVVCILLLPIPISLVSQSAPGKDLSEPFPCQSRPCGCQSAEQCWKKCCCFSNGQKIAWARTQGVKLPDYVVAAANKEASSKKKVCDLCLKGNEHTTPEPVEASKGLTTPAGKSSVLVSQDVVSKCEQPSDTCDKSSHHAPSDELRLKTPAFSSFFTLNITAASTSVTRVRSRPSAGPANHVQEKRKVLHHNSVEHNTKRPKVVQPVSVATETRPASSAGSSSSSPSSSASSKWVMAMYAAECQGQPAFAVYFVATIVPPRIVTVTQDSGVRETVIPESERLRSTTLLPPLPPPKIV